MPVQLASRQVVNFNKFINRKYGFGKGEPMLGVDYSEHLLGLFGLGSIVSYLPLWESPGETVAKDISRNANNGAYTAVTLGQAGIGDGRSAASFDGSTSFCNWYSAALVAAFNGAEGTLMLWAKVVNAEVWTNGVTSCFGALFTDASNEIELLKSNTNNTLRFYYRAGGTAAKDRSITVSPIEWFSIVMTWSKSDNQVRTYYNGLEQLTPMTTLGTWVGSPISSRCVIGALTITPSQVINGLLAHALLLNRAATAAEISEAHRIAF